jgi:perosamine synthetase
MAGKKKGTGKGNGKRIVKKPVSMSSPRKIFVSKPVFDKEMAAAAIAALENEKMVMGESVHKFEEAFAKYCGVDHCVTTSSGTSALQFILMALGINSPEQEVITTPASFIATANSILHANATPTFADIDKDNCLGSEKVSAAIGPATKAIMPVHLYGMPADMDALSEVALRANLPLIEDACQAHGAIYKGKKCGSLGLAGAFSFYSTKNLTVGGDGGAVTTNDMKLAKAIQKLRDCGRTTQYEHDVLGYTSRLNTVNAAIGLVQLKKLDKWNNHRRKLAELYRRKLAGVSGKISPPVQERASENTFGNYHLFAAKCPERDKLKEFLAANGIFCGTNYPVPIHLQPLYQARFAGNYHLGQFPVSEALSKQVICLPMYPELTPKDANYVASKVLDFFGV